MKFIVDTNVLLSYPKIFEEKKDLVITCGCLKEIDKLKNSDNIEIAFQARRASTLISERKNEINFIIERKKKLSIDDEILYLSKKYNYGIITNDINLQILSYYMGIKNEGYHNLGTYYTGIKTLQYEFDNLLSNPEVDKILATLQPPIKLNENEFLIIENKQTNAPHCIFRYYENGLKIIDKPHAIQNKWIQKILPRNTAQQCLFNLLFDKNIKIILAQGKFGSGKAQPNNILIPTPNGYKQLGELKIGDNVFDRFGKPTKVLGVYPQGVIDNYQIIFSDGRTTYCNDEHIWSCYTSKNNLKNFTLKEIINLGLWTETKQSRFRIPNAKAVEYDTKKYSIDPYVIGAFLGNGCCLERQLTISSQDEEIISEISKLIGAKGYNRQSNQNYSWHFLLNQEKEIIDEVSDFKSDIKFLTKEFFGQLKGIQEYNYNKYIPTEYKTGSINQRFSLLQGLLDTDGTIDNKGRIRFSTTSLKLAKDIQELCWSLGMGANIEEDHREEKYTTGACYNVQIMCENEDKKNLFRLKRKLNIALSIPKSKYSRKNKIAIVNVIKQEPVEMTCIYVDNEEHLYLTEQFIVTHNTICLANFALQELEKGRINKIIWVPNNSFNKDSREIAALPGSLYEKELPFLGSLVDIIGKSEVERLLNENLLEIIPISIMRGRNIEDSIILVNEAQNLTEEHIKLLVGRCAENTRIFFDGDIKQVDSYVFKNKNGLRLLLNLANSPIFSKIFGVVTLNIIERSLTAQASDYLDNIT